MSTTTEATALEQYLTFSLAGEAYAVEILKVREILEYQPVTVVPRMPPWIRGATNVRGNVVPVADLALKFNLGERKVTKRTCILLVDTVIEEQPTVVGVVADTVYQVTELSPDDIEPPPSFGTRIRPEGLLGMGKLGDELLLILDIDRALASSELAEIGTLPDEAIEQEASDGITEQEISDEAGEKEIPKDAEDSGTG
ncbi:MAG: chemotaxis protein CheW [Gemmatimonadales bacterium]|jgi:purine-binding chemotaxis protein CheW